VPKLFKIRGALVKGKSAAMHRFGEFRRQFGAISTFDGKNSPKSGSEARRCLARRSTTDRPHPRPVRTRRRRRRANRR
jgi:hypothetical protein